MDRLLLACVPFDMPLPDSFDKFESGTRALVVRGKPGGDFIVTVSGITDRMNAIADTGFDPATARIGDIRPDPALRSVDWPSGLDSAPAAASTSVLSDVERRLFHDHFERAYVATRSYSSGPGSRAGREPRLYSLRHIAENSALVVTASEHHAMDFRGGVVICRCEGDPVHTFDRRELKDPKICNKPHRKRVKCFGG